MWYVVVYNFRHEYHDVRNRTNHVSGEMEIKQGDMASEIGKLCGGAYLKQSEGCDDCSLQVCRCETFWVWDDGDMSVVL